MKQPPQQDSFDRILDDLFKDLETVQGNRTTHGQLQRIENLYRQRYENLKAQEEPKKES